MVVTEWMLAIAIKYKVEASGSKPPLHSRNCFVVAEEGKQFRSILLYDKNRIRSVAVRSTSRYYCVEWLA